MPRTLIFLWGDEGGGKDSTQWSRDSQLAHLVINDAPETTASLSHASTRRIHPQHLSILLLSRDNCPKIMRDVVGSRGGNVVLRRLSDQQITRQMNMGEHQGRQGELTKSML